jgi:ferredoxin
MAYVVTENCLDCKFTSCAAVCPVQAFREGPDMLYIDPDTCIDCNACVPECPVEAIFPDYELSGEQKKWIKINEEEAPKYPMIDVKRKALKGPRCINPNAGD